ncbi:bleomycin resistance protein [Litoreibacter janthinus]|uniref:Glyoxalase/fosfomycin resistance/dioxygenase domain-containing protein n=1 Tax=Litoreibacter janthinus TaxID=670154 RepID=A0A1I6H4C0_9RHOB|nr:VOC family protein [Litoreibacter janthinus]SFR49278.1 hypothetical protein SAMN04488002_2495 [Litoreibacter janthinus]
MPKLTQITPFLMCSDIKAEIAFFEDYLGFSTGFLSEGDYSYAFLRRDNAAVRLLTTDADLTDERCQNMIYIDVDDVDALWTELGPKLSTLPSGRVRAPFDQPYNQREFHVIDEGPNLILFGHSISPGK